MAQKVQVLLVDDIDGGEADETVSFSLDGVAYEVDLSAKNAEKMREALAPYVGVARRAGSGRSTTRARRSAAGGAAARRASGNTAEIREWARAEGFQVSERGRISAEVREAYEKAHG